MPFSAALPFSRIKEGSKVYGVVKVVNEFELVLSLADHHTAFVSCNRVSKHLEKTFADFTAGASGEASPPTLLSYFRVGQGVVGAVVAVSGGEKETAKPNRRRIEVSLQPCFVNAGLRLSDLETGQMLSVEISSIEDKGCLVDLGLDGGEGPVTGFVPFDSMTAAEREDLKIGALLPCAVVSVPKEKSRKKSTIVTLSAASRMSSPSVLQSFSSLQPGSFVKDALIVTGSESTLSCRINGSHDAIIDIFNLPVEKTLPYKSPSNGAIVQSLAANYPAGTHIPLCRVVYSEASVNGEKLLVLSALPTILLPDSVRCQIESAPNPVLSVGSRFEDARIVRIDPGLGVMIELKDPETGVFVAHGQVHISRLADEKMVKITDRFKLHSVHPSRIIDYDPFSSTAVVSMAPSTLSQPFLAISSIEVGAVVRGEVTKILPSGVQVAISDRIRALCPTAHLTETQSADALKKYSVGQKFRFRVLMADAAARKVLLTRKKGLVESELAPLTSVHSVQVGDFYDGFVAAIKPFGCIVRFFNDVKAILPKHELSIELVEDIKDIVFEGQVVRCRVIKVDSENGNLAVSLLTDDKKRAKNLSKSVQNAEKLLTKRAKTEAEQKTAASVSVSVSVSPVSTASPVPTALPVSAISSASPVSPPESPKKNPKMVMPSLRALEEEELARDDLVQQEREQGVPLMSSSSANNASALDGSFKDMCDEYERRLISSPNTSLLWIQYMSLLLKTNEIEAARSLAQRALQTISIRLDAEKLNIWVALMNLELAYGSLESLKATFERACVYNDSKKVHLSLVQIYEEAAKTELPDTIRRVEDFYTQQLQKKFRQSCKVWMNQARFLFAVKESPAQARKVLALALEALPRRKHVKATLKFAQMEFKHGSADRGRTLFEGILATSPSRLDIWLQFADQEERRLPESADALRRLYERIVSLRLSSKKAKFVFKRFLDFEKQWGDQLTVQRVKDLALQYVEASMSK